MSIAQVKSALVTTAIVLGVIYVARRVPGVGPVVSKALNG